MTADVPLLVIGGGIGGLTAALALARAGFTAHVAERSAEFGEIGAGIQLAPNALRVLDGLGVLPELASLGVHPGHLVLMHADTGRHLTTVDFGVPFEARYGYPYTVMHRGDLLTVLHEACRAEGRITLEAGREVTALADRGDVAEVGFADGGRYECGAVVGADGLWSTARKLVADDRPRTDACVAYRGTLAASDMARLVSKDSTPAEPDDEIIWIAPRKHLVQYPIRPGELYNQVAVFRSRGYRPATELAGPGLAGTGLAGTGLAGTGLADTGLADTGLAGSWGTPAELDDSYAGACPQVRAGVAVISRDRRWVMYDREPLDNWTTGRITLLGDAAHPMVQYLAQGACQAIEDAGSLARQLARYDGDPVKAFAAYQAERIPRTALVQRAAWIWGQIWHDDGMVIPLLRDRVLTRRDRQDYTDLDWLYASRPEAS